MTVLAKFRGGFFGGFMVFLKFFGGFEVFGTPLQRPLSGQKSESLS